GPKRSARLSAIARGLSITPATACESVRTLTQKGLVRKVRSETDERVVIITLSTEGQRKADHAAGQDGFLIAAAESLTPAEQEALLKIGRASCRERGQSDGVGEGIDRKKREGWQ